MSILVGIRSRGRKMALAGGITALVLSAVPGGGLAQEEVVLTNGREEYQAYCATCHGEKGKGDGPMADLLTVAPADLTQLRKKNDGEFPFWRGEGSAGNPDDDVFPARVRVTLVLADEGPAAAWTRLARPLSAEAREAEVLDTARFEGAGPFVRIGREWVRTRVLGPAALRLEERGARGTAARAHPAGEEVQTGRSFSVEIELPAFREDWNLDALAPGGGASGEAGRRP